MRSKPAYILATAFISFVLIGVVLLIIPETAGPYVLQIFGAMVTIITVLVGLDDTDARVEVLKADVADVKGVGVIQAQTLAKVSDKVDDNTAVTEQTKKTTDVIHALTNSHNDALETKIGNLEKRLEQALAIINRSIGERQAAPLEAAPLDRIATAIEAAIPPKDAP